MKLLFSLLGALSVLASSPAATARPPASPAPGQSFSLVFVDEFDDPRSIGSDPASDSAALWYRTAFFGFPTTPPSMISMSDGVLTLIGTAAQGASIHTAAPAPGANGWGGRTFRNGAYFEARIALGPLSAATRSAWPSFWSMSVEHMALKGAARWPGQPADYMRFIESDFFEFNPEWDRNKYYITLHEWFGRWDNVCGRGLWCNQSNNQDGNRAIALPAGTSFQEFHTYGQLWVPASQRASGYLQNYLDGAPVGPRITWQRGDPQPPSGGRLRYNVIDRQGLVVILSTGGQPMMVDWVRVWQLPTSAVERR